MANKPFGMNELLASVRASLRRAHGPPVNRTQTTLDSGDFHVDFESHQVSLRNEPIRLTPKEFDLFVYFIQHAGKLLVSRPSLT